MKMLESECGSSVAVRSTDQQGYNESYGSAEIDAILNLIDDCGYEFTGVVPVTADDIDIDVWAQDFNDEIKDNLSNDLNSGNLYVARFSSDECGEMELLVWK